MQCTFHGSDGVCWSKYFVRSDDPRRGRESTGETIINNKGTFIVWLMLSINLVFFVLITLSYLIINIKTLRSSDSTGQSDDPVRVPRKQRNEKRVTLLIGTNFACWVPFTIISALHNLKVIDASKWYLNFAMMVQPNNSVINPLLYDKTIIHFIGRKTINLVTLITNS